MKNIILLILVCGVMGSVRGQNVERNASVNVTCPSMYNIYQDVTLGLYFDTVGIWNFSNPCYSYSPGQEYIARFKPHCTNTYILEVGSNYFDVFYVSKSIKINSGICDSTGYTCLSPFYIDQTTGYWNEKYYLTVDSSFTYDILLDNLCPAGEHGWVAFTIYTPHVSNVQFYDITPDSISVSWDGTLDDVVLEYGLKGFTPGYDTIAGNGTLLKHIYSPITITGLFPDSNYDFNFRDKCGVYSQNILYRNRTARNPVTLPWTSCNGSFYFDFEGYFTADVGAWTFNTCGSNLHNSKEYIYKFIPDSSAVDSIHHFANSMNIYELGVYYKKASSGMNESSWICAGHGYSQYAWTLPFGPLEKDTLYYLMIKGDRPINASIQTQHFSIYCPTAVCSTAPTSITSNAVNNTICSGQSVTLTPVGGTLSSNGNFYWYADSCGGIAVNNGYSATFTPLDTITYYVRAEDSCGVTACASITINVNPAPSPPFITNLPFFCQGDSTSIIANAGYAAYLWSTGATTATSIVSAGGTYTVTVSNNNGCTASASTTVTVHPLPTATVSGVASICIGSCTNITVSFTGTMPFIYSYTNGSANFGPFTTSATTATITVCPTVTTTYTLISVNDVYCSGTVSGVATVTVHPIPVPVITGSTELCPGETTILNAGSGYANYQWSTGANTQTIMTGTGGIYIVTVTDMNGCIGSASVTVTVHPLPPAVINPSVTTYFCQGDSVHFTANSGTGYIYQWYKNTILISGAINSFYDAIVTGNYSFAVTDSNGCDSLSISTFAQIICVPVDTNISQRTGSLPDNDIVLVPNPASNELTIQTGKTLQSIKIFDVIGQQVFSTLLTPNSRLPAKIDIHTFSNGIYFVELNNGKEKVVKKFLKE